MPRSRWASADRCRYGTLAAATWQRGKRRSRRDSRAECRGGPLGRAAFRPLCPVVLGPKADGGRTRCSGTVIYVRKLFTSATQVVHLTNEYPIRSPRGQRRGSPMRTPRRCLTDPHPPAQDSPGPALVAGGRTGRGRPGPATGRGLRGWLPQRKSRRRHTGGS